MQLSLYSDYTLRVLMYLGLKSGRSSIDEIAKAYSISTNHLVKIVHHLGKLGLVETVRGRGGGICLGRQPEQIIIGEVLRRTENFEIVECFANADPGCVLDGTCLLKRALAEARDAFLERLDRVSLEDLLGERNQKKRALRKILQIIPA